MSEGRRRSRSSGPSSDTNSANQGKEAPAPAPSSRLGKRGRTPEAEARLQKVARKSHNSSNLNSETEGPLHGQRELGAAPAEEDEWQRTGSAYLGQRTRIRTDLGPQDTPAEYNATVVSWLPADVSNFRCSRTKGWAPLWRVEFDDPSITVQDLEEHEVKEGATLFAAWQAVMRKRSEATVGTAVPRAEQLPANRAAEPSLQRLPGAGGWGAGAGAGAMGGGRKVHCAAPDPVRAAPIPSMMRYFAGRKGFEEDTLKGLVGIAIPAGDEVEYKANKAELTQEGQLVFRGLIYPSLSDFIKACGGPPSADPWEAMTYQGRRLALLREDVALSKGLATGFGSPRAQNAPAGSFMSNKAMSMANASAQMQPNLARFLSSSTASAPAAGPAQPGHSAGRGGQQQPAVQRTAQAWGGSQSQSQSQSQSKKAVPNSQAGRGSAPGFASVLGRGLPPRAVEGEKENDDGAWRPSGHRFIGQRVRRLVYEGGKVKGHAEGKIVGWMTAEEADFVSERTGKYEPLWRCRYDDERVGSEDLEEDEVLEALDMYRRGHASEWIGRRLCRCFPGYGEMMGEIQRYDSETRRFLVNYVEGTWEWLTWEDVSLSAAHGPYSMKADTSKPGSHMAFQVLPDLYAGPVNADKARQADGSSQQHSGEAAQASAEGPAGKEEVKKEKTEASGGEESTQIEEEKGESPEQETTPAAGAGRGSAGAETEAEGGEAHRAAEKESESVGSSARRAQAMDDVAQTRRLNHLVIRQPVIPLHLEVNQLVECEDDGKFYPARVAQIDGPSGRARVHFLGWSSRHDRWVPLRSHRMRLPQDVDASGDGIIAAPTMAPPQMKTMDELKQFLRELDKGDDANGTRKSKRLSTQFGEPAGTDAEGAGSEGQGRTQTNILLNSAGMRVPSAKCHVMPGLILSCTAGLPASALRRCQASLERSEQVLRPSRPSITHLPPEPPQPPPLQPPQQRDLKGSRGGAKPAGGGGQPEAKRALVPPAGAGVTPPQPARKDNKGSSGGAGRPEAKGGGAPKSSSKTPGGSGVSGSEGMQGAGEGSWEAVTGADAVNRPRRLDLNRQRPVQIQPSRPAAKQQKSGGKDSAAPSSESKSETEAAGSKEPKKTAQTPSGASKSKVPEAPPEYSKDTKVQVLLDDGEWIDATLTGTRSKKGKYEIMFGPDDTIFAVLPNDYIRIKPA